MSSYIQCSDTEALHFTVSLYYPTNFIPHHFLILYLHQSIFLNQPSSLLLSLHQQQISSFQALERPQINILQLLPVF